MAWRRRKELDLPSDETVTNVLARLDAVVDRLEGVYGQIVPLLDPPRDEREDRRR